jgi:hypothetical protein
MQGYIPKTRLVKLDFRGSEFEGLEVSVSLSIPLGFLEDLRAGDEARVYDVISYMLKDWNLCDVKTGEPLGAPTKETIKKAPLDILMAIFEKAMEQMQAGGVKKNEETT